MGCESSKPSRLNGRSDHQSVVPLQNGQRDPEDNGSWSTGCSHPRRTAPHEDDYLSSHLKNLNICSDPELRHREPSPSKPGALKKSMTFSAKALGPPAENGDDQHREREMPKLTGRNINKVIFDNEVGDESERDTADRLLTELRMTDLSAADIERIYQHTLPSLRTETFYHVIGEQLISKGEPLMAEDVLYHGCKKYENSRRLCTLHARSLTQAGSVERAIKILEEVRTNGDTSDETAGLLARAYKDLATQAKEEETRKLNVDRAHQIYREAYERGGKTSYYLGINAATTALLGGSDGTAQQLAHDVLRLCQKELKFHDQNSASRYWVYATIGEANIIRGNFEQAREYYEKAVNLVGNDYVKLSSSRRQLMLLLRYAYVGAEADEYARSFDSLFSLPSVGVLLSSEKSSYVPSKDGVRKLQKQLRRIITRSNIKFAFATVNTLSDVFFLEEVLDHGGEIYIVLPIPEKEHMDVLHEYFSKRFDNSSGGLPTLAPNSVRKVVTAKPKSNAHVKQLIRRLSGGGDAIRQDSDLSSSSPYDEEEEEQADENNPLSRVSNLLSKAVRVDIANDLVPATLEINDHYCSLMLNGLATMRAKGLDTSIQRIYVQSQKSPGQSHQSRENLSDGGVERLAPVLPSVSSPFASAADSSSYIRPSNSPTTDVNESSGGINFATTEQSTTGRKRAISTASAFPPRHEQNSENSALQLRESFSSTGSPRGSSSGTILRARLGHLQRLLQDDEFGAENGSDSGASVSQSYLLSGLSSSQMPSAVQAWAHYDVPFRVLFMDCYENPLDTQFRRTSSGEKSITRSRSMSQESDERPASLNKRTNSLQVVGGPAERPRLIMGILFADIVGYSKLREHEVLSFVENFMGSVAAMIEDLPSSKRPCVKNTWGDAFYFVFFGISDAGEFALTLSDLVSKVKWKSIGLPDNLKIRVSLHAAPVYALVDPITGVKNYTGVHTSRAARIEPITPPGSVYCSQAFAAVAANLPANFECSYVGNVPLAKAYGMQPVYHVKWRGPQSQYSLDRVQKAFRRRYSNSVNQSSESNDIDYTDG
eukprot:gb/GECG01000025.1/.p1 GENE.gb/GECG01000025.1/~~gb/GECG01000025.1/.p1  ORF type:complete len:1054 (+),score=121.54 gb/GECG01000025.1/:1-3162(+)